jgi:hypothetical protein
MGVFSGQGPSSKVSTTSLSRRKSYCLKCSVPNAGPPVVSISTTRDSPIASGLPQAGIALAAGGVGAAESAGVVGAAVMICSKVAGLFLRASHFAGFWVD